MRRYVQTTKKSWRNVTVLIYLKSLESFRHEYVKSCSPAKSLVYVDENSSVVRNNGDVIVEVGDRSRTMDFPVAQKTIALRRKARAKIDYAATSSAASRSPAWKTSEEAKDAGNGVAASASLRAFPLHPVT